LKLDSQIIKQGGESTGNHLQLLRDSFGRAVRLEVMFRASEHGFSAAAFHAKCDDIEDTLTLVRTEFGRTLAGYSHYKWKPVSLGCVHDEGRRAFLLSFDQAEKYVPQEGKYLICYSPNCGPAFGGGSDLFIADGCNANSNSQAYFPHTYNREGSNKIANCQQSYIDFCGVPSGRNFRVVEYEVFRVLFQW
jgi:hypothetical protein